MNPRIQMIIAIVCSVMASSGFWAFLSNHSGYKDAKSELLMGLAYDRILFLGTMYLNRGCITYDEYEDLYKYLFKPYQRMGGDGRAKRIMDEVNKLQTCNKKHDLHIVRQSSTDDIE